MKEENIILDKSKAFALRIICLYKYLCQEKKEFVLSKQIVRSGTSIGAKADFYAKLSISLKEAAETEYWLEILHESDYIDDKSFNSINNDCTELLKILTSILKNRQQSHL